MGSAIKRVANYAVSDTAYGSSWDGVTDVAPSKNAVYDQMELRAPKANPTFSGLITSAGQIKFPATQSASSDVNTLDDYEEGKTTGKPTASTGSFTTASYTLYYTKIGRTITVVAGVSITNKGTATGAIIIPLPFNNNGSGIMTGRENSVTGKMLQGIIYSNQISVFNYDNTSAIGDGYTYYLSGVYNTV